MPKSQLLEEAQIYNPAINHECLKLSNLSEILLGYHRLQFESISKDCDDIVCLSKRRLLKSATCNIQPARLLLCRWPASISLLFNKHHDCKVRVEPEHLKLIYSIDMLLVYYLTGYEEFWAKECCHYIAPKRMTLEDAMCNIQQTHYIS